MIYCRDCRHFNAPSEGCWHPINTRESPIDGTALHEAHWKYALSMRTSQSTTDCGPNGRLFAPRLEVA